MGQFFLWPKLSDIIGQGYDLIQNLISKQTIQSNMSSLHQIEKYELPILNQSTDWLFKDPPFNPQFNYGQQDPSDSDISSLKETGPQDQSPNKANEYSAVFQKKKSWKKCTNVGKKYLDILFQWQKQFLSKIQPTKKQKYFIEESIEILKERKAERKNHEFNFNDLKFFFDSLGNQMEGLDRKGRKAFSQVLSDYFVQSMKLARSQVKDKVTYLRACKIYKLRCRSRDLSTRNDSS